jgi:hypothetical protein
MLEFKKVNFAPSLMDAKLTFTEVAIAAKMLNVGPAVR